MTARRGAARVVLGAALSLCAAALAPPARAGLPEPPPRPVSRLLRVATRATGADPAKARVTITLAGDPGCAPALRATLTGQLADVAAALAWSCRAAFDADEPFRERAGAGTDVRVWIDLSSADEARVTLQDEHQQRYFVRRLPLPDGIGEIGREEIADVVRSGTIAVLTGAAGALSPAEARVTISRWPAAPPRPAPPAPVAVAAVTARATPPASGPGTFELAPTWAAQALARELPFVQEVGVAAALSVGSGRYSWWSQAGYRLPAVYDGTSVGVRLTALSLRAGVTWWTSAARALRVGLGAAIGVRRVWFAPQGDALTIDPAAPAHFDTAAGRLVLALQVRASARLALRLELLCDVATADVHYDLKNGSGVTERTLTQWPVQPGIGLAAAWGWGV